MVRAVHISCLSLPDAPSSVFCIDIHTSPHEILRLDPGAYPERGKAADMPTSA